MHWIDLDHLPRLDGIVDHALTNRMIEGNTSGHTVIGRDVRSPFPSTGRR